MFLDRAHLKPWYLCWHKMNDSALILAMLTQSACQASMLMFSRLITIALQPQPVYLVSCQSVTATEAFQLKTVNVDIMITLQEKKIRNDMIHLVGTMNV